MTRQQIARLEALVEDVDKLRNEVPETDDTDGYARNLLSEALSHLRQALAVEKHAK